MKKMIFGFVFFSMIFATQMVDAQSRNNNTQHNQKVRIQKGVQHGTVTRNEARNLRTQQARIKSMKRTAMADGHISQSERRMIQNAERRASYKIYNQKHDRQSRY